MPRQPGAAGLLVAAVDAAVGEVLILPLEEVADVVQQRRDDQRLGRPLAHGQLGGLERMLGLGDGLAVISRRAAASEQVHDRVDDRHRSELPLTVRAPTPGPPTSGGVTAVVAAGRRWSTRKN